MFVDGAGAVDLCVKTIVRSKEFEGRAFGQQLGCGPRHKELLLIQLIDHVAGAGVDELDAEAGVGKLRARHDGLDTLLEG